MTRQRLYMVYGTGSDAVGLVGRITTPISQAGGNIVDLRQDVLHGLFSVLLVVDLAGTEMELQVFSDMVRRIGEETGLELSVDKYNPTPRDPEKENVLLILIGRDRPGIISSISETLGKYKANIEFAQSIGREGVFLTELRADISRSSIPLENLRATVHKAMAEMGIQAVFQSEDVFNKRKRVILFDIGGSFVAPELRDEIFEQTALSASDFEGQYTFSDVAGSLRKAASRLEGMPCEVLESIIQEIQPTPGTIELLQTLRTMGYKIALASNAFAPLADALKTKLGIDYAYGYPLPMDDDSKCITGEVPSHDLAGRDLERLVGEIIAAEGIRREDVAIISDRESTEAPGVRLELKLGQILDYYNKKIISRDALLGLLGSFGMPRE
ncbi:MAG: ACT domain-containing protein [Planctomycetota bacterium]